MIAKMIAWAPTRAHAIDKLRAALLATEISGVTTNISYLRTLLGHPAFRANDVNTGFIERFAADLVPHTPSDAAVEEAAVAVALRRELDHLGVQNRAAEPAVGQSAWVEAGRRQQLSRGSLVR